jgi:hypothetical protein
MDETFRFETGGRIRLYWQGVQRVHAKIIRDDRLRMKVLIVTDGQDPAILPTKRNDPWRGLKIFIVRPSR